MYVETVEEFNEHLLLQHLATGTKPEKERKAAEDKAEALHTSQPRGAEDELKNLLFGRESPQFGDEETEENTRDCDSPLVEEVEDEGPKGNDLLDFESAASVAFPIGPLATLYDTSSFVPPILPPPGPPKQNTSSSASNDILSLFEGHKTDQTTASSSTALVGQLWNFEKWH